MNYTQTLNTLSKFFADSVEKHMQDIDKAIEDIKKVKRNPYKKFGRRLHKEAKNDFIGYVYEQFGMN